MKRYEWINDNIDMINFFIDKLVIFIKKYDDEFSLNTNLDTFNLNFSNFLFNYYILNIESESIEYDKNFEYFESMYSTDIIDLFSEFKNIADGFTNDIFNHKYNNEAYSLTEFLFKNIVLEEDYNELKDEKSDEEIIYEEDYY